MQITTLKAEKTILIKDQEELQHTFTKYQSQGIECESNLQKDISKLKEMNRMALEENKRLRSKIISFQY